MNEAKISEIFMSFQGEGPYTGTRQLFIRFYGCSLQCAFCDTKPKTMTVMSREDLMRKILEFDKPYHSISLTGGEPLEQVDFLESFLPFVKPQTQKLIYLETNGIMPEQLSRIIKYVDIVAMDFKLPSSTGKRPFWSEHKRFLEIALAKEVFVKIVVTYNTTLEDITKAKEIIQSVSNKVPLIIQPVDPFNGINEPTEKRLAQIQRMCSGSLEKVRVMGQAHKKAGIK
ncbi:MAG: 7-carboxy-7-deazaguanine synthase QueE [Candidatus Omnitrophica bacterium]|nr:7-carboxy-7-deazaguanine synthase QueE [Candidatus Omnitrophota bacterium]